MDKSFLQIDPDRLDIEWLGQPLKLYEYSVLLAEAKLDLDNAKNTFDVLEAELELEIRSNPEKYSLVKETEKEITLVLRNQVPYQNAQRMLAKKKHAVDILWAAVNALDHRKKALESLVSLHGQQYFAAPRAKGAGREVMDKEAKRAVRTLGRRREQEED